MAENIWPEGKKCAFCLGFDMDSNLIWFNKIKDMENGMQFIKGPSVGEYGPKRGVDRIMNLLENAVANAVRTALSAVFNTVRRIASKFFGIIAHTASDVFGEINKIHLSYVKKHRKPLQNSHEIVYNKESSEDNSGGSETGHVIKAQVRRGVNT